MPTFWPGRFQPWLAAKTCTSAFCASNLSALLPWRAGVSVQPTLPLPVTGTPSACTLERAGVGKNSLAGAAEVFTALLIGTTVALDELRGTTGDCTFLIDIGCSSFEI